jgi:sigma-B regulation protein RsbU (phosphoserine phosphatase)
MTAIIPPDDKYLKALCEKFKIQVASLYKPVAEAGGDFYDFIDCDENNLAIYLWDFSGHGETAAANSLKLHSIIKNLNKQNHIAPAEFMSIINDKLINMIDRSNFATMFYAVYDKKTKILNYSCAACPPPALLSFRKKEVKLIDINDFPLGVVANHKYQSQQIDCSSWDALLLYSDALIETEASADTPMLAIEYIAHKLVNDLNPPLTALAIKNNILSIFGDNRMESIQDDLTISVIRFD